MCGIFGYIGSNNLRIEKNILPHRGPDDWGVADFQFGKKKITFFQSRLSIIGLGVQGHQPYQKYAGKYLVYNGEFYNYLDIRNQLSNEFKIAFETNTDTEVLYESIINWGIDKTLEVINGMFVFSFYDINSENIYIARDQLGVKPLYYSQSEDHFIFSSEVKTFFELGIIKAELNKDFLGEYLANGWIYEPDTLFKNIYKLQSGHMVKYNILSGDMTSLKYWDISDCNKIIEYPKIENIITSQTISDVPIGNYFSGGIDSSIITFILKNKNLLNLNMDMADSESVRVNLMRQAYNLDLNKIQYQRENLQIYEKLIYHLDEPIADPAIIPAFQLAKESRKLGRYVMMSGMGGDEIDAGYSRHAILSNSFLLYIARLTPRIIIKIVFRGKKRRDVYRLKEFSQDKSPQNYFSLTSYFNKTEINILIKSNNWFKLYSDKIVNTCKHISNKKKYYYLDIKGFLASHNLIYMDKASMAASVEVRVPLLDKDLAKFFFKDIDKKKYIGKKRLKSYLKSLLGSNFHKSKKEGFRYDIDSWLLHEIDWESVVQLFQKNKLLDTDMLNSYIKARTRDLQSVSMKLWTIYTLFLWIKVFNVIIQDETANTRS